MTEPTQHARASAPDRSLRRVLLGSALWTLVVWGSRLGLIEADAGAWAHTRVYVSLAFGIGLLALAVTRWHLIRSAGVVLMLSYGMWMLVAWVPSIINVLGSSQSAAFQAVHTVLAVGSLTSGAVVAGAARRLALYPPMTTSTHTEAKSAAR